MIYDQRVWIFDFYKKVMEFNPSAGFTQHAGNENVFRRVTTMNRYGDFTKRRVMDKDKKAPPKTDKEKEAQKKKESDELDRELEQTFPASDPPSHTNPLHNEKENRK